MNNVKEIIWQSFYSKVHCKLCPITYRIRYYEEGFVAWNETKDKIDNQIQSKMLLPTRQELRNVL